ncbi:hypothetical protein [Deinococcus sp.]|uniref:hypothetical protein n=1 Tax=Deinococcus sp. TaxID=47478 RepID=UPI00391A0AA7
MRIAIRTALDFLIQRIWMTYLVTAVLSIAIVLTIPDVTIQKFIKNSLPAIPGVAFSLFGFAITAVSILVSLKGSPFFTLMQRQNFILWKNLISTFLQEAGLYAVFGLFTLIVSVDDMASFKGNTDLAAKFIYCFLFLSAVLVTLCAIYSLRLVANAPVVDDTRPTPIDASSLQSFQDPANRLPPRQI